MRAMDNPKSVVVSGSGNEVIEQPTYPKFNPHEHLIEIKNSKGKALYLEVKWRLCWFREACPNGTIETEMVLLDLDRETEEETYAWNSETRRSEKIIKRAPGLAIFRATVKDGNGGIATGTKTEKAASFGDFVEKAETGAIGRALAALGYGTQFAPELEEGHRIVDSPVEPRTQQRQQPSQAEQEAYKKRRVVVESEPVQSPPSLADSYKRGVETGAWTKDSFYAAVSTALGVPVARNTTLSTEQLKKLAEEAEKGPVTVE